MIIKLLPQKTFDIDTSDSLINVNNNIICINKTGYIIPKDTVTIDSCVPIIEGRKDSFGIWNITIIYQYNDNEHFNVGVPGDEFPTITLEPIGDTYLDNLDNLINLTGKTQMQVDAEVLNTQIAQMDQQLLTLDSSIDQPTEYLFEQFNLTPSMRIQNIIKQKQMLRQQRGDLVARRGQT